jgi:hypothetical protein
MVQAEVTSASRELLSTCVAISVEQESAVRKASR